MRPTRSASTRRTPTHARCSRPRPTTFGANGAAPASSAPPSAATAQPTSFAGGRYEVRRFLGEGGKKKVYLAHDSLLDRDVAFALIKTEGLDDASRDAHPARGAGDGPPRRTPAHRHRLRPRRAVDGAALHGHRAHGRRRRRGAGREGAGAPRAARAGAAHRARGVRGPRVRARARHRAPRPQARERLADRATASRRSATSASPSRSTAAV